MRTGRPRVPLILTDVERRQLASMAHRARTVPQWARRARIVLACAEGTPFIWTKTADEILASIARFAQRTLTLATAR
jgi:hypothetical protein